MNYSTVIVEILIEFSRQATREINRGVYTAYQDQVTVPEISM